MRECHPFPIVLQRSPWDTGVCGFSRDAAAQAGFKRQPATVPHLLPLCDSFLWRSCAISAAVRHVELTL